MKQSKIYPHSSDPDSALFDFDNKVQGMYQEHLKRLQSELAAQAMGCRSR